jgi:hypothetical protein
MSEYKPDETKTHLMYIIEARKNSPHDKCLDQFSGKVHSKDECEQLIASLKKLGYRLQVSRVSSTDVLDEEMPGEED